MSVIYQYLADAGVVDPALSWCTGIVFVIAVFLMLRALGLIFKQ